MKAHSTLHILLICKTLPWQFKGGIQTHTWELARSLASKGHQVSILNGGSFRKRTKVEEKEGIRIIEVPYFPGRYIKPISLIAEELSFNWSVLHWVRKNHMKFDIIHAQGRSGYLLSFYSKIHHRLVNTVHGLIDIENKGKKWYHINHQLHHTFTRRMEKRLYNSAAGLVAVSEALKQEIYERRPTGKSINVITNGVSSQWSDSKSELAGVAKFLFVGRLHPVKGISKIVEVMEQAADHVQLDIIGNGSERVRIEQIIKSKKLESRVRLLGEYSNDKIHEVLPYYTALILPSQYETQGIVLLEANSESIPVIASDLPAIRETIENGENGILCPDHNPKAFIEAMNYMAENRELAKAMGIKGRTRVKARFTWEKIAERTETLYRSIAQ